jgi:hypothetical protein
MNLRQGDLAHGRVGETDPKYVRLGVHRALFTATVSAGSVLREVRAVVVACASQVSGIAVTWVRCEGRLEWGGDGSRRKQGRIDVCEDVDVVGVG